MREKKEERRASSCDSRAPFTRALCVLSACKRHLRRGSEDAALKTRDTVACPQKGIMLNTRAPLGSRAGAHDVEKKARGETGPRFTASRLALCRRHSKRGLHVALASNTRGRNNA